MRLINCVLFFLPMLATSLPLPSQEVSENTAHLIVETNPLDENQRSCTGRFVAHNLDHVTRVPGGEKVRMFEANGSGVGINDLDGDGYLDIVLANHADANTILWNDGNLNFRTERIVQGESRAVTIVDVDGDNLLDVVFSQTNRAPSYWHNEGNRQFIREYLGGVGKPLYAMNWADLDRDGDLDLVGATYDASLLTDYGQEFVTSGNSGVFYYENHNEQFQLNTLAISAQALALILVDLNEDGKLDIWVGNDFALPDQAWYRTDKGWEQFSGLTTISYSTMSLDFGDINNDGRNEVYSTDMKPLANDSPGEAELQNIIEGIKAEQQPNDVQITANVLQTLGEFENWAQVAGVDATGWSWSGKFGDLDQDGLLDLYVVNGFIEISTFADLPNHELIEENQVFRNTNGMHFEHQENWELGSIRSGRGMSMADIDRDGDLDIVVNNLRNQAQLFENQLCEGSSLQVDLFWRESNNTRAIGTKLILHTSQGSYFREIRAASGYISGDASRIHFGFPAGAEVEQLEIRWPDGVISTINLLQQNSILKLTRNE